MSYATTNPYTGEVLKTFPNATDSEVTEALDKAHSTFLSWRNTSFATRPKIMQSAADILSSELEPYAKWLCVCGARRR